MSHRALSKEEVLSYTFPRFSLTRLDPAENRICYLMCTVIVIGMPPSCSAWVKTVGKSQVERSPIHLQAAEKTSFLKMETGFGCEARVSDGRRLSLKPDLECFLVLRK